MPLDTGFNDNEKSKGTKPGANDESRRLAKFWLEQVQYVDDVNKNWFRRGDTIIKRFRDERALAGEDARRRLNVLWANIKVLMPALYGKMPIPYVERRFLQHDPVARLSSTMLERVLKNELEVNGLHGSVRRAVLDYLLAGRGSVWVRYEPEIGQGASIPIESQGEFEDGLIKDEGKKVEQSPKSNKLATTGEQLLSEQTPVDYVNWKDLYLFPSTARTWSEVQAVGKRIYISKKEAIQRFGQAIGSQLEYTVNNTDQQRRVPYNDTAIFRSKNQREIEAYEIWNKVDRRVYWVSTGYDYLCDIKNDPLELKDFFPIPEPIFATLTNESLVPVPDYIEYQDQAIQIDELTQRLAMLTKACKIAGCYDGSNGALKRLFQEGFENDLIPVDAWAAFAEKGGVQGGVALLPIEEIQKVIETLTKVRQQLMMDLDMVTGISDVLRGTTDSRETLGGIRLKNNNAGTRLSDRQNEVARFARDAIALVGEICAKHYSDDKLIESSAVLYDEELQPEAIMEEFAPPPPKQEEQQPGQQGQDQGGQNNQPPFMGGINQLMAPPPAPMDGNPQAQLPNLNPRAPLPMNSPMGTAPQEPFFPEPPVDPLEIITERIEGAIELLREDIPRGYRIDIETDSTIFGDAAQERQDAAAFLGEVSKFLAGSAQLGAELPEAVPALCQMLLWGVRKFRVGRDLEAAFDDFTNKVRKRTKEEEKNPTPSPEEQKANAQIESVKLKTQADQQKAMLDHQHATQQNQQELQKQQSEAQLDAQMAQMDFQLKQQEHEMKMKEMQMKHQLEMLKMQAQIKQMQMQTEAKQAETHMSMQQSQQQHQQTMEQSETQHQQTMQQTEMKGEQAAEQHDQKMQQTELQGEQQEAAHKQKMTETKLTGQQKDAQHKQKMAQAKTKPKANK